jgi:hypothetical protein
MATTTNFGWTTPNDTDLVKDGAAAIRTLGSSIDTSFVDLKGGTTGQLLTKASATDLDFSWATPAGGGKVLQVVNATYSTTTTSTSSTYADTGLSATITPTSATSKILIIASQNGIQKAVQDTFCKLRLLRGATSIIEFEVQAANTGTTTTNEIGASGTNYLDSPATTSATTYKTQFANGGATGFVRVQNGVCSSSITLLEIGA